jgi:hypothetical protein
VEYLAAEELVVEAVEVCFLAVEVVDKPDNLVKMVAEPEGKVVMAH